MIGWCIVYYKKEGFVRWFAVLEVGFAFGVVASLGRDLVLGLFAFLGRGLRR